MSHETETNWEKAVSLDTVGVTYVSEGKILKKVGHSSWTVETKDGSAALSPQEVARILSRVGRKHRFYAKPGAPSKVRYISDDNRKLVIDEIKAAQKAWTGAYWSHIAICNGEVVRDKWNNPTRCKGESDCDTCNLAREKATTAAQCGDRAIYLLTHGVVSEIAAIRELETAVCLESTFGMGYVWSTPLRLLALATNSVLAIHNMERLLG
jgi:hypothetical protein